MTLQYGDVVYQCDTCSRKTRIPLSLPGLEVMQRCIITENCPGKLYPVNNVAEANNTPAITPEVPGLNDWFPRKILFTFIQAITNVQWLVVHNLGSKPLVQVLVDRYDAENSKYGLELSPDQYQVDIIDLNTLTITFTRAESGLAQCIGTASSNLVNPITIPTPVVYTQPLTGNHELTIATTASAPVISVSVVYRGNNGVDTTVTYVGIDDAPSINSPWVGVNVIHINGRNYTVRSFNILTNMPAPSYFANGLIRDGSPIFFTGFSSNINENFILLGKPPFAAVDKISDQVLDIATINTTSPATFYNLGEMYAPSTSIRSIYPPVIVVA